MKKIKFFAAALGLLTFAACSNSDDVFTGSEDLAAEALQDNAITFTTYTGSAAQTKAQTTGAMTTSTLQNSGFGVFAYYTGANDYAMDATAPNFMYNQKIQYDDSRTVDATHYATKWYYTPLKYWPNEVLGGSVDDADGDASNNPASSTGSGKVSFFAYAPYVAAGDLADEGIKAFSSNATAGDPKVTYVLPDADTKIVDLLWGTYDGTSKNVLTSGNAGVSYSASGSDYQKAILSNGSTGYTLNADLTKQKTQGVIGFAFKHALAKVGGYSADATNAHSGLMVVLDLDNETNGAEKGGTKEDATKVTITSINIEARSIYDDGGTEKYLKKGEGVLNLATGKWTVTSDADYLTANTTSNTGARVTDYNIGGTSDNTINTTIAEPTLTANENDWSKVPAGVLTTPQNVYANEAQPLVFIPGTKPELTITITYTVRTKDPNLAATNNSEGQWSKVVQTIKKKVTFANVVELNKQYSLLMHLGLTGVKFTATVSDWDKVGNVADDGTITGNVVETNLPINVK